MSYYSLLGNYIQRVKDSPYWEYDRLDKEIDAAISQAVAEGNYKIIPELKALRRPMKAVYDEGRRAIKDGVDNDELVVVCRQAYSAATRVYGED